MSATLAVLILTFVTSAYSCCLYETVRGRVKEALITSKLNAESSSHCLQSTCLCSVSCAFSFNPLSKACWKSDIFPSLDLVKFVVVADSDPWVTYYISTPLDPPSGLWMFDDRDKGKNLGKMGSPMNWTVPGIVFNAVGPIGTSGRRYANYTGPGIPTMHNLQNGIRLFDFSKPYTISFWVRTDLVEETMMIWDSTPQSGLELFFEPSTNRDQLSLNPVYPHHMYTTVRNATWRDEWRHIAVTYQSVGNVRFYLNAEIWSHTTAITSPDILQPDILCAFKHCTHSKHFFGSFACMSLFDRVLEQPEISFMKNACP